MHDCKTMCRQAVAGYSNAGRKLFTNLPVSAIICVKELPVKRNLSHTVYPCKKGGEQYE